MTRCLLTGFEPFDGDAVNPSWQIAEAIAADAPPGATVVAERLPCTFGGAAGALERALRRHRPQLVIAIGQAGRPAISLERVAINVIDARIADNAGVQPVDEPVRAGGPAAYFSTLPIKAMVRALRDAGIAAEVSQTAGTYVCNQVFYALMHALRRRPDVRGGFIHVPMLPEQAAARDQVTGMPLATQLRGVRLALVTAIGCGDDLREAGGAID